MANLIGQKLGQYEIISLLGKGGMATVYRARQESVEREVAIKVILPNLTDTEVFIERFNREARMVASLSHPHILKVFDYGKHGDTFYLVMELLTGGSLTDLLKKGPLSIDMTKTMLEQMSLALDYAHRRGIVHRDLKPQNVLLDDDKNAFLTDFGLAKPLGANSGITQSGAILGTPSYMAPEQWRGENVDGRADIYALGIILFEMLGGRVPFSAETPFSLMHAHVYEDPPLLSMIKPDISPLIDDVIMRALAKDREDRFGSAVELNSAFKAALMGETMEIMISKPHPPKPPEEKVPASHKMDTGAGIKTNARGDLPAAAKPKVPIALIAGIVVVVLIAVIAIGLIAKSNSDSAAASTQTQVAQVALAQTVTAVIQQTATFEPPAGAAKTALAVANMTSSAAAVTNTPSATVPSLSFSVNPPQVDVTGQTITIPLSAQNADAVTDYKIEIINSSNRVLVTDQIKRTPSETTIQESIAGLTAGTYTVNVKALNIDGNVLAQSESKFTYTPPTATPTITPTNTFTPTFTPTTPPTLTPTVTEGPSATAQPQTQVMYLAKGNRGQQIFVVNVDGSNPLALTSANDFNLEPAWSPDAQQIAFVNRTNQSLGIYVMDADGNNIRRLTLDTDSEFPAWSPDGKEIAFISTRNKAHDVFIMDSDGGNQEALSQQAKATYIAWSPDGSNIAMVSSGLYVINVDTKAQRQLSKDAKIRMAEWSPSSDDILYATDASIFIIGADGSQQEQLADGTDPAWSPDGSKIVYASQGSVFVMNADGSNQQELVSGAEPAWSLDGKHIAYSSGGNVFIMDADGTNQKQLVAGGSPVWSR